ncbi:Uncharacterised protein [Raoultella planticola]|nr:Uncharacterised protein [Raoultella planticola]
MNMKRGGLLVYVVMIVVGILGLFFYFNQSRTAAPLQASQPEKKTAADHQRGDSYP